MLKWGNIEPPNQNPVFKASWCIELNDESLTSYGLWLKGALACKGVFGILGCLALGWWIKRATD